MSEGDAYLTVQNTSDSGGALKHCIYFLLGRDVAQTQTTRAERAVLAALAAKARRAAEIGVFEGVTTATMAAAMPHDGVLYGVDPFFRGRLGVAYGRIITSVGLRRAKVRHKVRLVELPSAEAAKVIHEPLDLVFIDGDHEYHAVAKDWTDWAEKIAEGGVIAMHDTQVPAFDPGRASLGSVRFFQDTIKLDPRFEMIDVVDSLSVLRRKAG